MSPLSVNHWRENTSVWVAYCGRPTRLFVRGERLELEVERVSCQACAELRRTELEHKNLTETIRRELERWDAQKRRAS